MKCVYLEHCKEEMNPEINFYCNLMDRVNKIHHILNMKDLNTKFSNYESGVTVFTPLVHGEIFHVIEFLITISWL
jgi:hypothetical protein